MIGGTFSAGRQHSAVQGHDTALLASRITPLARLALFGVLAQPLARINREIALSHRNRQAIRVHRRSLTCLPS
jgi:hypothetical protein